jgi:hypothetical protein
MRRPGSGDVTIAKSFKLNPELCPFCKLLAVSAGGAGGSTSIGRFLARYAKAPGRRLWLVMDARKKHCQKKSSPVECVAEISSLSDRRMATLKFSINLRVLSKSSLVSSSRPGRRASIIDFMAGLRAIACRRRRYCSNRSRYGDRTARDAKDRAGARPGKYSGRSLESPSTPMTENT